MWTALEPLKRLPTAIHITWQCSGQHAGVSLCPLSWGNKSQWVSMVSSQTSSNAGCKHAPMWVNALASPPSTPYLISLSCTSVFGELIPLAYWFEHGKVKF